MVLKFVAEFCPNFGNYLGQNMIELIYELLS